MTTACTSIGRCRSSETPCACSSSSTSRGPTTGKLVRMLFDAGALEVHVRISAPPVRHPCFYGIDMATQQELVAASHTPEQIRRLIGATTLGYLSLEGVVRAVGLKKDKF